MAKLEVITGPMFAGKSDELIRLLKLARHADMQVLVVKPKRDSRAKKEIASRKMDGNGTDFKRDSSFPAFGVKTPGEVEALIKSQQPDILGIDEAQFLSLDFIRLLKKLLESKEYRHLKIIAAGLDMTSEGDPIGPMPAFMALADKVIKMKAVCFRCKEWPPTATMSYYKIGKKENPIIVGDADKYEARCRCCWNIRPD
jgi:thymidine kinase